MRSPSARSRAALPEAAGAILDRRTLAADHRALAGRLRPGLRVLDVGCGSGAITRGIAEAVSPDGYAVGIDSNPSLLRRAAHAGAAVRALAFVCGDAYALPFRAAFDVVGAARVLQWLERPEEALRSMLEAVRPGGRVLVLDYDHTRIAWQDEPPPTMIAFYDAFLRWRADAGLDNAIARRLESLFREAGLRDVVVRPAHEVAERGDPDFRARLSIWADVAASRGHQMVADGYVTEELRAAAEADYRRWVAEEARSQAMYLLTVEGVRSAGG